MNVLRRNYLLPPFFICDVFELTNIIQNEDYFEGNFFIVKYIFDYSILSVAVKISFEQKDETDPNKVR
jgi:hypothetical protein